VVNSPKIRAESPCHGELPAHSLIRKTAQWTPKAKDHKLRNVASSFDECFLAIVTDEPGIDEWLSRDAAEETRPVSPCYVTERRAGAKNKPAGFWCRRAISNRKLDQNSAGR
jgi:hypothetical protein